MAPKLSPNVLSMWNEINNISIDFNKSVPLNQSAKAKYRLINVLWNTQLQELLAITVDHRIQANHIIDAVRGVTPRPVLDSYPGPGSTPTYPKGSQLAKTDTSATDSYTPTISLSAERSEEPHLSLLYPIVPIRPILPLPIRPPIRPIPLPPSPLPPWWYIGEELYKMVLRGDYYLNTPVEFINGPNFGIWAASMFYGMMGLVYCYMTYADAEATARSYIVRYRSALNKRSRSR